MILTTNYLKERHQYWAQKLFSLGIFKYNLKQIDFEIKYNVKTYNGMFRVRSNSGTIIEKIIIYPNIRDIDEKWVDNILVHEMIHQYIYDHCLKDNSIHGIQFCKIMNEINRSNLGLNICISSAAPAPEEKTYLVHKILLLKFSDCFYLCKVKSTSVDYFNNMILTGRLSWKKPLISFGWYKTNNSFFQNYSECTKRLKGIVFPIDTITNKFEEFNLQKINVIEEL